MNVFSGSFNSLERALNYSSVKQKVTAQNIANVDVPNYKAKSVSFKNVLADSSIKANRTDPRHLSFDSNQNSIVIKNQNTQYQHNGNNVDVDKEMTDLASNQIYYQALVERLNGKFSMLQTVIRGGK